MQTSQKKRKVKLDALESQTAISRACARAHADCEAAKDVLSQARANLRAAEVDGMEKAKRDAEEVRALDQRTADETVQKAQDEKDAAESKLTDIKAKGQQAWAQYHAAERL
jgi:hypothetical protein